MTVNDLIEHLKCFDEDALIAYEDPNFIGVYEEREFTADAIGQKDDVVLISFPFESPVEW